jgi:hypothetical protein
MYFYNNVAKKRQICGINDIAVQLWTFASLPYGQLVEFGAFAGRSRDLGLWNIGLRPDQPIPP